MCISVCNTDHMTGLRPTIAIDSSPVTCVYKQHSRTAIECSIKNNLTSPQATHPVANHSALPSQHPFAVLGRYMKICVESGEAERRTLRGRHYERKNIDTVAISRK